MDAVMLRKMAKWHQIMWNVTDEYNTKSGGVVNGECIGKRKGNKQRKQV
jgi:hypothetical protein